MARVLLLTELLPYPLVAGAKIRAYYVLRHLAARHQVTLVSFIRADDRPQDMAHLRKFLVGMHVVPMQRSWARNARAVLASLVTGRPAIIHREQIGAMQRRVEALLRTGEFDVVHADQITMAHYGLLGQGTKVQRLLDQHNATFRIFERLARSERNSLVRALLEREGRAFARYESGVCQRYDQVTFVTEEDRQLMVGRMPAGSLEGRSRVIAICVDTDAVEKVLPIQTPFRVTHVGSMCWSPNVKGLTWFWQEIWPAVHARLPEARLTLIGKDPSDRILAWGRRPDVDVLGYLEDLTPYLAETAVFVVPLQAGAGMRVKIVDAWCWGLPIVSTRVGAEGVAAREGEDLLLADRPAEFTEAVIGIWRNVALQQRLRTNGRRWVEAQYDWRRVYGAWDEVYDRLAQA
jgi:glycosyltransferase involved in cell wall biosynthesis